MCRCAERGCVRRSEPIQQSALPVCSVETETEANGTSGERKFTRCKPAAAVRSAAKPVCRALSDGSRSRAHKSLSPSAPKHQTNSHSSSDWPPERCCCCCCCLHGRVLPLPDFQADLNSASVVLLQETNALMCWGFRKAWRSIAEAHICAFTFCVNGAQKGETAAHHRLIRREREEEERERENKRREGRAEAEIYSFFHCGLSEMMSAPNEFPSRVLLP